MAEAGNCGGFLSVALVAAAIVPGGLVTSGCRPAERNTAPATQPHRRSDRQGQVATTRPISTNQPSTMAGKILDDILAATDKKHTDGFRAPATQPASRPARAVRVRFIRLKYDGSNNTWNINMGHGFDYNLLLKFNEITGFKIADNTEFKEISRLARFCKGKAPPFVYMTGRGGISLSPSETKILRDYCLVEGGMILADSAGGHFDRSFRSMCKRLFPGKPLVDVPDDDPLYREPFIFPKGAPPLWHHNNKYRPQGIKHEGAWVVYYHAGDMGDAWKTGHSGASKTVSDRAYKLGINIMYYTFTRYLKKHHPEPTTRPGKKADK